MEENHISRDVRERMKGKKGVERRGRRRGRRRRRRRDRERTVERREEIK